MPFSTGRNVLMKYTTMHSPTAIDDFTILAPIGGNVNFKILTPVKKALILNG